METAERLSIILQQRAKDLPPEIKRRLQGCADVIIFGSYASGLESKSSDIDVFGVGEVRTHYKTPAIEIMILPEHDLYSDLWLGSELANHVAAFGIPLGPRPAWLDLAKIGPDAAARKQRRVRAYVRSLERHWQQLSPSAKCRYEIKLRRELQRLQLLQVGKPVPSTPALDRSFVPKSQYDLIASSRLPSSIQRSLSKLISVKIRIGHRTTRGIKPRS